MGKTNDFNLVYHISRILFPEITEVLGLVRDTEFQSSLLHYFVNVGLGKIL